MFINIETELTTAFTDLFLAIISFFIAISLFYKFKAVDLSKSFLWFRTFFFLAISSVLGFIVHGFVLSTKANYILWQFLNFFLAFMMAYFALSALADLNKKYIKKKIQYYFLFLGFIVFIISAIFIDTFLPFVIYEAVIMLMVLGIYLYLAIRKKRKFAYIFALAVFFSIFAAVIQAGKLFAFHLYYDFDHNSVFHILESISIILMYISLVKMHKLK